MSRLVEHARAELARIGEDQDVIDHIVGVIAKFCEFGHSGGSAMTIIPVIEKLLRGQALSPLTSDPAEWEDRSKMSGTPLWQNKRDSRAFSTDGGQTWTLVSATDSAKIKALPLPGDAPDAFLLVVSNWEGTPEDLGRLREESGARAVLVSERPLEVV